MFITSGVIILFYFATELFPTQLRGNALGLASLFSQLGGIVSPWFMRLETGMALSFLGGMVVFTGCLSFLLPETQGVPFLMSIRETTSLYDQSFSDKSEKIKNILK